MYPPDTLSRMKDSGLRIRIERNLRERFLAICHKEDRPAAQVLRQFIRDYVEGRETARLADAENQKESAAQ